jgi:hypothetical protein
MLTLSKPLSAGQAIRYHEQEFTNGRDNYYTERDQIVGTWHGQLAKTWAVLRKYSCRCNNTALRCLWFETILVMQPAQNWRRDDAMSGWDPMATRRVDRET